MIKKTCKVCGKAFKAFKEEYDTCPKCKKPDAQNKGGGVTMTMPTRHEHNRNQGGGGGGYRQNQGRQGGGGRQGDGGGRQGGGSQYGGGGRNQEQPLNQEFKLDSFYTDSGAIRREVYVDVSEGIASQFNREQITRSAIRRFFETVRSASEQYRHSSDMPYEQALEKIRKLRTYAHYAQQRKVTKQCFTDFMYHYIELAEKDPKNLKGFKELFESIVGYLKREN